MQGFSELKKVIEKIPKSDNNALTQTVVNSLGKDIEGRIDKKIDDGLKAAYTNGQSRATGINHEEASAIKSHLGRIEDSISISDTTEKKNKIIRILSYCLIGAILMALFIGWYSVSIHKERNELLKVEWLYRLKRAISSNTDFINRAEKEKEILRGTEKDFEEWKTIIVNREASGPEFVYFSPHDDWKPKLRKEESNPQPQPKPASVKPTSENKPLPHERKYKMTEGEIEAIKAMRANPHIPEDVKPPLPEGY